MELRCRVRAFVLHQLFSLYYFYKVVQKHRIYYVRNHFLRVDQYLAKYCLFQYEALYRLDTRADTLYPLTEYPLYLSKLVFHVQYPTFHMFGMLLRCTAIIFVPYFTDTEEKRILIGTEMFKEDRIYLDSTLLLWSNIGYLFLKFSLTTSLLDYKFLALFLMTDGEAEQCWRYVSFGLTPKEYDKFDRFRFRCSLLYYVIIGTIPPGASLCIIFLFSRASLYQTNLVSSLFWASYITVWIFYVCVIIYSNMVAFIVVTKYVQIKQRSLTGAIQHSCALLCSRLACTERGDSSLWPLWRRFVEHNVRYTHLQDELREYNRFWASYLSFVFLNYVLLICCFIYIIFFSATALYFKLIYVWVGLVHVVLLSAIIYYCGSIVLRNARLTTAFTELLAHFVHSYPKISKCNLLKMHNIGQYLCLTPSGFSLLNKYVIRNDTFRLLAANIMMYFILIMKK